jgi:hypothetical protein
MPAPVLPRRTPAIAGFRLHHAAETGAHRQRMEGIRARWLANILRERARIVATRRIPAHPMRALMNLALVILHRAFCAPAPDGLVREPHDLREMPVDRLLTVLALMAVLFEAADNLGLVEMKFVLFAAPDVFEHFGVADCRIGIVRPPLVGHVLPARAVLIENAIFGVALRL